MMTSQPRAGRRRLRKHQQMALNYARRVDHPALFMQMRLGKTLVAIRRVETYPSRGRDKQVLVVAPNSALGSWEDDLREEGYGDAFINLQGTRPERLEMLRGRQPWKLINKEAHLHVPELARVRWDAVVLDESTFIKNPKSLVTKYHLKNFRSVPHKWTLTGTPNPQSDLDFWCQMAFLQRNPFGCPSYWSFRARYFKSPTFGYDWFPKLGTPTFIKNWLAEHAFIMSRADAGMDVPKVYERRTFPLPPALVKAYAELEESFILEYKGKEISRTKYAPVKLHWLRQLCGGFLDKKLMWKGKLLELSSLLDGELAGDQVVVWFSYNHEIEAAKEHLTECKISCDHIWGRGMKVEAREKKRRAFQAGAFRVILVQVKVAEMGMNLSAADTAIYYCPPFGGLARSQTEDRILALYKKGPLLIIDLCIEDSVDTALLEALQARVMGQGFTLSRIYKIMERQHAQRLRN